MGGCLSHMHVLAYRGRRLKLGVFLNGSPPGSLKQGFSVEPRVSLFRGLSVSASVYARITDRWSAPTQLLFRFYIFYLVCVPAPVFVYVCAYGEQRTAYESALCCYRSTRDQTQDQNHLAANGFTC